MKPPCMAVVKYLLPTIRVLVMKELIETHNLRKIDASSKMELTPAAITQYFKGKRGSSFIQEIEQSEETMRMVSELSKYLVNEDASLEMATDRLCKICNSIRAKGLEKFLNQGPNQSNLENK